MSIDKCPYCEGGVVDEAAPGIRACTSCHRAEGTPIYDLLHGGRDE